MCFMSEIFILITDMHFEKDMQVRDNEPISEIVFGLKRASRNILLYFDYSTTFCKALYELKRDDYTISFTGENISSVPVRN